MAPKTGRKRNNDTAAEKLPKKKTKDSPEPVKAKETPISPAVDPASLVGDARARTAVTTTTTSSTATETVEMGNENGGVVANPPRSTLSADDTAPADRSSAKASDDPVPEEATGEKTEEAVAVPAPVKKKSSALFSSVFVLAFVLLLTNLATLGLWMQYSLEVDIDAREIALVAKEENAAKMKELQSQVDDLTAEIGSLNEKVAAATESSQVYRRESMKGIAERNSAQKRLEKLQNALEECQATKSE